VQADGTIVESNQTRSTSFGGTTLARDPADLSADFVFQSKGVVSADGYVVEVRIPFKSLKYQSADVQSWGLNIVRQEQHSGTRTAGRRRAERPVVPRAVRHARRLNDLRRGLVVDVNPEITQRTAGIPNTPGVVGGWSYDRRRPEIGGNARWGVTNNLTLNGTVNPDFSQIESDAGQLYSIPGSPLLRREAAILPGRN